MLIALLFFRPGTSLRISLAAWVLVALPVLVYLAAHPEERQSARGLELMLILGPVALVLAVMIPLQRRRERRMMDLRQAERRARTRAIRDPLTNLFNRRAFEDRLARTVAHGGRAQQLILMDIDHFKSINDTHGHPAGDAVLCVIASRCDAALGRSAFFARWGGEEFAAICPLDEGDPRHTAERLRVAIAAQPIDPAGPVTASFGVTRIRTDDGLDTVLKRADEALYAAKQAGRNRVETG